MVAVLTSCAVYTYYFGEDPDASLILFSRTEARFLGTSSYVHLR